MNKKKKTYNIFKAAVTMTIVLVLLLPSTTAYTNTNDTNDIKAETQKINEYNGTMTVKNMSAHKGEDGLIVEISGDWPTTLAAYAICLNYDPEILELHYVDFTDTIGENADFCTIWGSDEPGNLTAAAIWRIQNAEPGAGLLMKVVFNVSETVPDCETIINLKESLKIQQVTKYVQPPGYGYTPILNDGIITIREKNICGDADNNGIVNISDAVFIINYIFGDNTAPNPLCLGDIDSNGIINISDAVYLIANIFGDGPSIATPNDCLCSPP